MGIKQRPLSALFPMHLPNLVQNGDEETLREITIEILSPEELKIKQSFVKNKSILLIESSGFVPGDQLVAVNGTNVQDLDRDEVQKLIKTALTTGNQSISLKVRFFILEFLSLVIQTRIRFLFNHDCFLIGLQHLK